MQPRAPFTDEIVRRLSAALAMPPAEIEALLHVPVDPAIGAGIDRPGSRALHR